MTEGGTPPATTEHARAAAPVPTEWGEAWVMKSCVFPVDLLYDVEHDMWARPGPDGLVHIGLTDVGQTAGGKLQVVSFPKAEKRIGTRIPPNRTVALMESAKWLGPVRLPVAGELVAVNDALRERPGLVNLDPYGRGWVVAFLPDEDIPWLAGDDARLAYRERLRRTFRSVAGVNDDFWCVHCNDWDD